MLRKTTTKKHIAAEYLVDIPDASVRATVILRIYNYNRNSNSGDFRYRMFFRRMFERKGDIGNLDDDENGNSNDVDETDERDNDRNWSDYESYRNCRRHSKRNGYRKYFGVATAPAAIATSSYGRDFPSMRNRNGISNSTTTSPSLQLTPLWEHILRTRSLPENVCPSKMFAEFNERLRDPEWQVRQHALRVLVDVLVVMSNLADLYMEEVIPQLVENLGHPAPTVRKGALDCLRVYLTETAMPETIMLQVLDIGLNQKITNEPFGGRLTCGVMLSLPALVQSTFHQTSKRHFILQATIDMLVQKMGKITHQEITLKVLSKIEELIDNREFMEYMSHEAYREFELLCNVYGVKRSNEEQQSKLSSSAQWHCIPPRSSCPWRSPDEEQLLNCTPHGKVIMETEIKINDDTLTMRILEAKDDNSDVVMESDAKASNCQEDEFSNSLEDEIICGHSTGSRNDREISDVTHMLSESKIGDNNKAECYTVVTPSTPLRTPKRVTFGGEVIKMRTPDSDATTSNNSSNNENGSQKSQNFESTTETNVKNSHITELPSGIISVCKTSELSVEIPNDNTKPLTLPSPRPKSSQSPKHAPNQVETSLLNSVPSTTSATNFSQPPVKRRDSANSLSLSPFKRISVSPVDSIISPKTQHKEIEVLHNLQRDPSPLRMRSVKTVNQSVDSESPSVKLSNLEDNKSTEAPPPQRSKTWEDLDIIDQNAINNLRSGNWRLRLQGILQLENALRSSENLALVQLHLDSLLFTLLSSERNREVAEVKHRILINLISRLPLDNLEDRTTQIMTGICHQGGAGANYICMSLMQRLLPAVIVLKLLSQDFLHAKSSRFREHALQIAMYALMTHPSSSFDTERCIRNATLAALNRKCRVRLAALDVLAILGQVTSTRIVMNVVQRVADETQRDDGIMLVAAVKARLSRKQLPLITADGTVQYTLRLNGKKATDIIGNGQFGPDIEWIIAGVGSVSPTLLRRRSHRTRNSSREGFYYLPQQNGNSDSVGDFSNKTDGSNTSYASNEENQSHKVQHVLGNGFSLTTKKTNLDFLNYKNRRLVAKSCSDSSMEGRSSDSNYTSSSGSGNVEGNTACDSGTGEGSGITGRFTRQTISSRFPSMNLPSKYIGVHRPTLYQTGMGAYAYLQQQQYNMQSVYPKNNSNLPPQNRRKLHQSQKETFKNISQKQQKNAILRDNLDGTYTICQEISNNNNRTPATALKTNQQYQQQPGNGGDNNISRRFVNIQKFKSQTSRDLQINALPLRTPLPSSASPEEKAESKQETPSSTKSVTYSQKSTASARSIGTGGTENSILEQEYTRNCIENEVLSANEVSPKNSPKQILEMSSENDKTISHYAVEENVLENKSKDIEEEICLDRSSSVVSLQSKTESIKTQVEDTTPAISRTQSSKSLVIEEDIEGTDSFFLVEDVATQQLHSENAKYVDRKSPTVRSIDEACNEDDIENDIDCETPRDIEGKENIASSRPSSTVIELKTISRRNSLIKSMESLYERKAISNAAGDFFDTTTEASSESSNQLVQINSSSILPAKPQHTPLKQKAKTTCFLRGHRRVSPVKQSIKMQQTELYPSSLQSFDKPREALFKTFDQLDSTNWETVMQGLKSIVRLMRYHSDFLESQMHMICIQLTRSVRNLRSQVARASCQAASELFNLKSKSLEQECDDLVCALLHRTADTNRFLRADATKALESMCNSLSPQKILNILTTKGALHANALVRTTTAKLLNGLVDRLGFEKVYQMPREYRDKFFLTGANLLLEGSLETRNYAKSLFRALSEHPNYDRLLIEIIPIRTYRNIEKTLKSIR